MFILLRLHGKLGKCAYVLTFFVRTYVIRKPLRTTLLPVKVLLSDKLNIREDKKRKETILHNRVQIAFEIKIFFIVSLINKTK